MTVRGRLSFSTSVSFPELPLTRTASGSPKTGQLITGLTATQPSPGNSSGPPATLQPLAPKPTSIDMSRGKITVGDPGNDSGWRGTMVRLPPLLPPATDTSTAKRSGRASGPQD